MITWVIYDIVSNKTRNKVKRVCKDAGLHRVQKSVFLGDIVENVFDEIQIKIKDIINLNTDSVYVFTMTKKELQMAGLIGQAFDKKYVTNEIIAKFF